MAKGIEASGKVEREGGRGGSVAEVI